MFRLFLFLNSVNPTPTPTRGVSTSSEYEYYPGRPVHLVCNRGTEQDQVDVETGSVTEETRSKNGSIQTLHR